ncbi:MAG TPA: hypothetical protein VF170_17840, partial [Planctomycetaceae bacterium]
AFSPTNDFREAEWTDRPMPGRDGRYEASLGPTKDRDTRIAAFGELRFVDRTTDPPLRFSLTTTVKTWLPERAASE